MTRTKIEERKRKPELLIGRDTPPSQLLLEVVVALSERLIGIGLSREPDPTNLEVLSKGCEGHLEVGRQVSRPGIGPGGLGRWLAGGRFYIGELGGGRREIGILTGLPRGRSLRRSLHLDH